VRLAFHRGRIDAFIQGEAQAAYPRNRANTRFVPARLLFGLGARVRVWRGLTVAAEVDNLFDDQRLQDVFGYPLPGRGVRISLRYTLPGAQP
jgi:outer membrane cobalamin receptor